MTYNIAIDGPAGAGKSTIARRVAGELSFIYVDTGAMYRTIALGLLREGIDAGNGAQVEAALPQIQVSIAYRDGEQQMLLNGENVSGLIRTEEVGNMASRAAALPCVREKLLDLQKELARTHNVVMDGRDIGTNILPEAQLKIYLTASADTRAARRQKELQEKGIPCSFEKIRDDIIKRDDQDMHREIAPLMQAADAVYLDSSDMTIDEVTEKIKSLVNV
ncbi:cytidylate kinase [Marvinbryantia formatexigens DSM 14469]|uniref:Cytidylate kinase n=1 Tax=Marvinbryantia formatexigens DSM 14469 TaxID=478749 RepID=C6LMI7_9FIRM|nr:(d)CMP kinase [Marvinbryantia formatexigens]EET58160.1 cytidylate kinase [Marvinbryantia formatexigens DSM 14469]UWO25469.1 (d)CMP kinase [Marvinbryantia formatexigens DSM 14469]SDG90917.1 cytidylate kinase [Marvinbryantia formatexigens]